MESDALFSMQSNTKEILCGKIMSKSFFAPLLNISWVLAFIVLVLSAGLYTMIWGMASLAFGRPLPPAGWTDWLGIAAIAILGFISIRRLLNNSREN
jgi:hypothetical protein